MKLYGYRNENGSIEQAEIEVEEKAVLVPKEQSNFPFTYDKQIDRADVGRVIGYYPTIFLKNKDFEYAKEKFLERKKEELAEKEKYVEKQNEGLKKMREEINKLEQSVNKTDDELEQN